MSDQVLVFEVHGVPDKAYAIDVERVLNVIEPSRMTPVPLIPRLVRGIVSHRGRIVTVVDAGVLLQADGAVEDTDLTPRSSGYFPFARQLGRDYVAQVLVLRDGSRDTGHVGLEVSRIRNLESARTLSDAVAVLDVEAMRAELEARVSNAIENLGVHR